jgi:hypothetical protein
MHAGETERAEDNSLVPAVVAQYYHALQREDRKNSLPRARRPGADAAGLSPPQEQPRRHRASWGRPGLQP